MNSDGALVARFQLQKLLNQDSNGRRVALLGQIDHERALLLVERAAFASDRDVLQRLVQSLSHVRNLGDNDVYKWYMASTNQDEECSPELKMTLMYPCSDKHIAKYSAQEYRMVTETAETYRQKILPYMERSQHQGRLNWVYNILDGRAEQENVIAREGTGEDAFILTPDSNWDRHTMASLHLLAIVQRRDLYSLRSLRVRHVPWLKWIQQEILAVTTQKYGLEADQLKLFLHYQPTFYHLHIHVVNCMSEATSTQAVGKAFSFANIISQLESMSDDDAGMHQPTLTYTVGMQHDLWRDVFLPLKQASLS